MFPNKENCVLIQYLQIKIIIPRFILNFDLDFTVPTVNNQNNQRYGATNIQVTFTLIKKNIHHAERGYSSCSIFTEHLHIITITVLTTMIK